MLKCFFHKFSGFVFIFTVKFILTCNCIIRCHLVFNISISPSIRKVLQTLLIYHAVYLFNHSFLFNIRLFHSLSSFFFFSHYKQYGNKQLCAQSLFLNFKFLLFNIFLKNIESMGIINILRQIGFQKDSICSLSCEHFSFAFFPSLTCLEICGVPSLP